MAGFGPIKRDALIANLRRLRFDGPKAGGKHQYMRRGNVRVRVPNPHGGDVTPGLLRQILKQAGVSDEEWRNL
jgi:predicted RNA binding protein YcfA (HicA-like mRNA interferase family)